VNPPTRVAAERAHIRYAQVWEDADVLLAALDVQPGDTCLSIASAGDNALALLTRNPARVVALDLSPAQIACVELRAAAYRTSSHAELLELMGSRPSTRRAALYARARPLLSHDARAFWDGRPEAVDAGIGSAGRFEHYFKVFRTRVLPLVHGRATIDALLTPRDRAARERFYEERWNTWRWRLLFRLFFSRWTMSRLGRDPQFFRFADEDLASHLLGRTRHALTELDPAANPYVRWILTGTHGDELPCALRPEHFETIRANIDRLEWRCESLETYLAAVPRGTFQRYNLSDLFEYVPPYHYRRLLESIVAASAPGGRLVYWNMLVPRSRPETMAHLLEPLEALGTRLHLADRTFFYRALVVEAVR
jgi:S-adenosylmethionine-diacylglycerol 3-amino-3-carboxypropyl transferase